MGCVPHAQSNDRQKCHVTREQEAQNVGVQLLLLRIAFRNCPSEKRWKTQNCQTYSSNGRLSLCLVLRLHSTSTLSFFKTAFAVIIQIIRKNKQCAVS